MKVKKIFILHFFFFFFLQFGLEVSQQHCQDLGGDR